MSDAYGPARVWDAVGELLTEHMPGSITRETIRDHAPGTAEDEVEMVFEIIQGEM
jgi:hypothetical protein